MWDINLGNTHDVSLESAGKIKGCLAHRAGLWDSLEGWRRDFFFSIPRNSRDFYRIFKICSPYGCKYDIVTAFVKMRDSQAEGAWGREAVAWRRGKGLKSLLSSFSACLGAAKCPHSRIADCAGASSFLHNKWKRQIKLRGIDVSQK